MFQMFKQLFISVTLFFAGLEKIASAFNHIGTWTDKHALALADKVRIERQKKLAKLKSELKAVESKSA